ncbi:hypothetical protein K493DRAFT_315498 [Basidiobolus meristosporus CBS 931.73]|uniref:Phosphoesterase-domain-containing protein n=1 Tax=Basidiobolus meristosporus CBS 931.73 TaxID=1314790 RepID=A0A1Y1Y977_9FUNG|nr:hypothetical protein K493DRAFT_315498 [Basidiobolus meristosporus CBS 931.73]|eukprot:ORX94445.1 hypothetical protein K493DRAFT_315498 [Basidiobolus meristosporus CBS 931.73]
MFTNRLSILLAWLSTGIPYAALAAKNDTSQVLSRNSLPPDGKWFNRIMIVMLENTDFDVAAKNQYFTDIAKRGLLLTNFYGVTHPSKGNYIAQVYGSFEDLEDDGPKTFAGNNLVDLLESKMLSWKAYQEDYPGNCFPGNTDLYFEKHNPFITMENVRNRPERCAKIVDASELDKDIRMDTLPHLIYFTPNILNDAHDTDISFAANWLKKFIEPKLANAELMDEMLVVITFDERESFNSSNDPDNKVFTVLLGKGIQQLPNGIDSTRYDHYSLLRTIEDNWELGTLGRNDTKAYPFKNLVPLIDLAQKELGEDDF